MLTSSWTRTSLQLCRETGLTVCVVVDIQKMNTDETKKIGVLNALNITKD